MTYIISWEWHNSIFLRTVTHSWFNKKRACFNCNLCSIFLPFITVYISRDQNINPSFLECSNKFMTHHPRTHTRTHILSVKGVIYCPVSPHFLQLKLRPSELIFSALSYAYILPCTRSTHRERSVELCHFCSVIAANLIRKPPNLWRV